MAGDVPAPVPPPGLGQPGSGTLPPEPRRSQDPAMLALIRELLMHRDRETAALKAGDWTRAAEERQAQDALHAKLRAAIEGQ
jgi:hypothetical protein